MESEDLVVNVIDFYHEVLRVELDVLSAHVLILLFAALSHVEAAVSQSIEVQRVIVEPCGLRACARIHPASDMRSF